MSSTIDPNNSNATDNSVLKPTDQTVNEKQVATTSDIAEKVINNSSSDNATLSKKSDNQTTPNANIIISDSDSDVSSTPSSPNRLESDDKIDQNLNASGDDGQNSSSSSTNSSPLRSDVEDDNSSSGLSPTSNSSSSSNINNDNNNDKTNSLNKVKIGAVALLLLLVAGGAYYSYNRGWLNPILPDRFQKLTAGGE
ncbi:hypothetical protein [Candidatus Neptunochlamydia vexilliferae]|uniref:hypothetical protein n=1 Tax=Candidatus Neptunichlamydia vexilliferae TaxID=1651774 RepID=UPI001890FF8A|nr:hypothetical protein [Candidatus Neptunochlamydia vexilliferae]